MKQVKLFLFIGLITLFFNSIIYAQQTGSLRGQVVDSLGASVVGATVTAVDAGGKEKNSVTNSQGEFTINGLAPGNYIVRATATNFGLYENTAVAVVAGQREELTIALTVEAVAENVEVSGTNQISTDSENNASATVLNEKDLEALPDDPDELEAALQALAGPSAGPNGGQIYIDGFTGGRLPPRDAIREIRINQNPFSAEFERLGFGRIEVLTKPGADRWRGQAFFNFNDESLNARNPFAVNRASSQLKFYGGSVSGPIQKGKSSFFFDISNRQTDNTAIVNALILDPTLNIVPFQEEFPLPSRRFSVSPRFDYQLNDKNTLVARYSFTKSSIDNEGIRDFSLPSRAYKISNVEHEFRLTETMIINPKTVNETRFEYEVENSERWATIRFRPSMFYRHSPAAVRKSARVLTVKKVLNCKIIRPRRSAKAHSTLSNSAHGFGIQISKTARKTTSAEHSFFRALLVFRRLVNISKMFWAATTRVLIRANLPSRREIR